MKWRLIVIIKLSTFLSCRQICGVNCLKVESLYDFIQPHTTLYCTIGGGWQSATKQVEYSSSGRKRKRKEKKMNKSKKTNLGSAICPLNQGRSKEN